MSFSFSTMGAPVSIVEEVQRLNRKNDPLVIRTLLRKSLGERYNLKQWSLVREIIHKRLEVGFDLIFYWDKIGKRILGGRVPEIEKLILSGDKAMLSENYKMATKLYAKAALKLRKPLLKEEGQHKMLYYRVLHNLGRAFYGSGDFDRAIETYSLIASEYYKYRQVLHETMWSAFRGKKYDKALGAIASQKSNYFSPFLPPESYLVQLYIYKNLCREDDFKIATGGINRYIKALETGQYNWVDWAKENIETRALLQLARQAEFVESNLVQAKEVNKERRRIVRALKRRFSSIKKGRLYRLNRVLGYSRLAVLEKTPTLKPVTDLESPAVLREKGYEYWPVSDAEEWVDELGLHFFVGSSQCKK